MRKSLLMMAAVVGAAVGCDNGQTNVLGGVSAIAYIQRTPADTGNVFDYTGGGTDGNIFTLTPPTASGVKKNLTNWIGGDVNAMDLSFDAREIVFSGKAPGDDRYHVFRINVDGTQPVRRRGRQGLGGSLPDHRWAPTTRSIRSTCRAAASSTSPTRTSRAARCRSSATSTSAPPRRRSATMKLDGSRPDPRTAQRLAPRRADAAVRRPRAAHRVAPPRRHQRRRPHHHEPGPDRRARRLRPRGQGPDQQLPARQGGRARPARGHRHLARPHLPGGQDPARQPRRRRHHHAVRGALVGRGL